MEFLSELSGNVRDYQRVVHPDIFGMTSAATADAEAANDAAAEDAKGHERKEMSQPADVPKLTKEKPGQSAQPEEAGEAGEAGQSAQPVDASKAFKNEPKNMAENEPGNEANNEPGTEPKNE